MESFVLFPLLHHNCQNESTKSFITRATLPLHRPVGDPTRASVRGTIVEKQATGCGRPPLCGKCWGHRDHIFSTHGGPRPMQGVAWDKRWKSRAISRS